MMRMILPCSCMRTGSVRMKNRIDWLSTLHLFVNSVHTNWNGGSAFSHNMQRNYCYTYGWAAEKYIMLSICLSNCLSSILQSLHESIDVFRGNITWTQTGICCICFHIFMFKHCPYCLYLSYSAFILYLYYCLHFYLYLHYILYFAYSNSCTCVHRHLNIFACFCCHHHTSLSTLLLFQPVLNKWITVQCNR